MSIKDKGYRYKKCNAYGYHIPCSGYLFDDQEIRYAVDLYFHDKQLAIKVYGNMEEWNTSCVTDMSQLFKNQILFNVNISRWDVSNVIYMDEMFAFCKHFNQPIGIWDTSKVITMEAMFAGATLFNQDIKLFNTMNVISMKQMFYAACSFNQNIGSWNTKNVQDMSYMFYQALLFNNKIGEWNTENVKYMQYMFFKASTFNQNLSSWNVESVSSVSDFENMFGTTSNNNNLSENNKGCINKSWSIQSPNIWTNTIYGKEWPITCYQPITQENIQKAVNLWIRNKSRAKKIYGPINKWNTSTVTDMSNLFENKTTFNSNISNWNTSKVKR